MNYFRLTAGIIYYLFDIFNVISDEYMIIEQVYSHNINKTLVAPDLRNLYSNQRTAHPLSSI